MTKMRLYIAGPMDGQPDHGYPVFNEVEEHIKLGCSLVVDRRIWAAVDDIKVINPARNFNGNPDLSRWQYFEKDIPQVAKADWIVLLPGYETSAGVDLEIRVGFECGAQFIEATLDNWTHWTFHEVEYADLKRYDELEPMQVIVDEVVNFAQDVLDVEVSPWQRDVLGKVYDPFYNPVHQDALAQERKRDMAGVRPCMQCDTFHNGDEPCSPIGFTIKDSGARQDYASGMRRDLQVGKPDYTLLPLEFLKRWADHMTKGAEKYGRNNWRLANSQEELRRFQSSALRHMMQWLDGDRDEDHASAVAFNVAACEFVLERLEQDEQVPLASLGIDSLPPEF